MYKAMQADYTRKTQELAEQRQQFEALGDPEVIQQAVDLYGRISDPQNWQQLHAELSQAMVQMGMTPAEAQAAAADAITQEAQAQQSQFDGIEDPELAPIVRELQDTRARLDALQAANDQDMLNREAERQYITTVNELQRQEAAIRESHPDWGDEKIAAVYEMSSFFNGNLAQAAGRLEGLLSAERELYLNQKAGALQDSTRTPATTFDPAATKHEEPATLKDAEAEATEFFTARLAELGE